MAQTPEDDPGIIFDELNRLYSDFAEEFKILFDLELTMDLAELANVAQSYVFDLGRYVKFHEVEIPDRARRSAYLAKWLMKLRPVHYTNDLKSLSDENASMLILCNELFSLYVLSSILRIDLEAKISARMGNILLYSLRYRATSEDSFILFFAQLCLLK